MIDLEALRVGATVRDDAGRPVATIEAIRGGEIRLTRLDDWSPRKSYLDLTEVERTDREGLHLKAGR